MIDKKFEFRMPLLRRRTRVKKNIAKHFIVESNESNQSQSSIRDLIFSTEEGPAGLLCLSLICCQVDECCFVFVSLFVLSRLSLSGLSVNTFGYRITLMLLRSYSIQAPFDN